MPLPAAMPCLRNNPTYLRKSLTGTLPDTMFEHMGVLGILDSRLTGHRTDHNRHDRVENFTHLITGSTCIANIMSIKFCNEAKSRHARHMGANRYGLQCWWPPPTYSGSTALLSSQGWRQNAWSRALKSFPL